MPIKIQSDLPARSVLEKENIFVMTEQRAKTQDSRISCTAFESLITRKMCLDACRQLTRTERFDDIIIRPQSECAYFIDILKTRRDHEDGDIVCFPNITLHR